MNLKKTINKFLKPLGVKAVEREEFQAWYWKNKISYSLAPWQMYNDEFMESFRKRYPEIKTDEFVISILHEVGHCKVLPTEISKDNKIEKAIEKGKVNSTEYYKLFDERVATAWAAEYIIAHPKRIAKFEKKLEKYLTLKSE